MWHGGTSLPLPEFAWPSRVSNPAKHLERAFHLETLHTPYVPSTRKNLENHTSTLLCCMRFVLSLFCSFASDCWIQTRPYRSGRFEH